ncbi:TPA: replication initiator protein A [Staphylococcus aureus]|nr:replication initiator protein A [Staphylococcus aureus]
MKTNYYEIPRYVYEDNKYKSLNHNSKLLYAILLDDFVKMQRYHKNNPDTSYFKDEQLNTYIAPTREHLAHLLNCSIDTITRLKKQLSVHELLKEVRTGRNQPNRLYPIVPTNVAGDGYIKVPQLLFKDKYYRNMSGIAKIVYSCLDARFNMSKKNGYKDEKGHVYCKYSYKTLIKYLNCSRYAFKRAKDELIALGLMSQAKETQSYSMKYFMKSPYTREDNKTNTEDKAIKEATSKTSSNQHVYKGHDKIEPTDTTKLNRQDTTKLNQNYPTSIYPTYSQPRTNVKSVMYDKSMSKEGSISLNTHDISKNQLSDSINEKQRYLKQYPEEIAQALAPYDLEEIQSYMSIICNTKNQHNLEMDRDFTLEDMAYELARTIDQVKRTMKRKNETPKAMFGYFKVAIIDCIEEFDIAVTLEQLREDLNFSEHELKESEENMRKRKQRRMENNKHQSVA